MGDAAYEADDMILRLDRPRVRRDLVNPPAPPAGTDEPVHEHDKSHVTVDLDPIGTVARVVIEPASTEIHDEGHGDVG